ncbi:MAG: hypothetical protein P8016_01670 [Sedimentisphaerales bacterium]
MDWSQLRTILWLRWRLTRNQWSRGGTLNLILTLIIMIIVLLIGAIGGIAGLLFGAFALDTFSPVRMLVMWDVIIAAFLFFWVIGLVSEIQRSESIDIGKLLHLPASLKDIFIINYFASLLTLSIIVFVPVMLGLCIGLALGRSLMMAVPAQTTNSHSRGDCLFYINNTASEYAGKRLWSPRKASSRDTRTNTKRRADKSW